MLVPFPFSDLSTAKLRPALVLAAAGHGDWICLQITSNSYGDPLAVSLQRISFIRPAKLFTAHSSLFQRQVGEISPAKLEQVRQAVIELIRSGGIGQIPFRPP
ncbi:MAG: type II toxin-antitoxin system PemK/MazF family toxin [Methylohalobius sp.]